MVLGGALSPPSAGRLIRRFALSMTTCSMCAQDLGQVVRHWRSTPFTRRQLAWVIVANQYSKIGGFDSRCRIAADYFSILSLYSQPGFKAVYLPQVLVAMRVGGASNRAPQNVIRKSREDLDALRRTGVGGLVALVRKNAGKLGQFFRQG